MLAIDLGVPTRQLAPCRRNPKGAGVFGPQALSFVGHDDKASFRSSFRACDPNTPARDPTDFHHGLLTGGRELAGARFSRFAEVLFDFLDLYEVLGVESQ